MDVRLKCTAGSFLKMSEREENLAKMEDQELAKQFKKLLERTDEALRYVVTALVRKSPFLKDESLVLDWSPYELHKWYKEHEAEPVQGVPTVAQQPHMLQPNHTH